MNELDYYVPEHLQQCTGKLVTMLESFVSNERIAKLTKVVESRTRHVLTVFEATHHCHNISAVLRTTDFIGFQDVFFVYPKLPKLRYKDSVERGSAEWLNLRSTDSIIKCIQKLKNANYKILLVALPSFENSSSHFQHMLPQFSAVDLLTPKFWEWTNGQRIAVVFGNEALGLSKEWSEAADGYAFIPKVGFAESLNLSVCAGIVLNNLRCALEKNNEATSSLLLNENAKKILLDLWLVKSLSISRKIINEKSPDMKEYFEFLLAGNFFKPF